MSGENFVPWLLDIGAAERVETLEETVRGLLRFLVLAPSSHNSQPWQAWTKGPVLYIAPNYLRALPESDVNHRQLFISIGCGLENVVTAADFYGIAPVVTYFPKEDERAVVRIDCSHASGKQGGADHIVHAIARRRTNRSKYESRMPDTAFINWLSERSDGGISLHLVKDSGQKEVVAKVVSEALLAAMDDAGFREELSFYIKNNVTRSKLGMPMSGFGMPTPLSFLAPFILKRFNVNRASRKADEELLTKHTPVFAVISSSGDEPRDWMESGQLFQRIALNAEKHGIATAPMAAAIQIGEYHQHLARAAKTSGRPQVFFRMGYAKELPPHSPRLSAEEIELPV